MRLYYNTTSPYARKTLIVVHEKGLLDRIEHKLVDPWADGAEFHAAVPVGKVPALIADDGLLITESTTICEYLDNQSAKRPLISPANRWDVLSRVALAQGLIDAAFATAIEGRRPADKQWPDVVARHKRAMVRAITAARVEPGRFDLGDIALASGLSYADFRVADVDWRKQRPDLVEWYEGVAQRPSMTATKPA